LPALVLALYCLAALPIRDEAGILRYGVSPQIARSYFVEVEITSHTGVCALAISGYGVCLNNTFRQP
jgi:hypothetical protein